MTKRKIFFSITDKKVTHQKLSAIHLLLFFSTYIFINILMSPFAQLVNGFFSIKITNEVFFISLLNLLAQLSILILFSLIFIFIGKESKIIFKNSKTSIFSDIYFGLLYFLISLPVIILSIYVVEKILKIMIKKIVLPEQLAVDFLRKSLLYPKSFILAIISIAIFAPIIEEILFRGVLQNFFKKFLSMKKSIILTSIIFSLAHFSISQKMSNIIIIITLFILSVILGVAYEKRKSLYTPMTIHFLFNSFTILNILFFKDFNL